MIINVLVENADDAHAYFGRYEHELRLEDGSGRISQKIVPLMNDVVPTMLDIYGI